MYEAHDAFLCIGEKTYVDEQNRKRYSDSHYFKNSVELSNLYSDIPEALENNYNFPYRFSFKLKKSKPILPNLKSLSSLNEKDELLQQSKLGLEKRLKNFILKEKKNNNSPDNNSFT